MKPNGGIVIFLYLISCIATNVQAKTFIINGENVPVVQPFYAYIEISRTPGDTYFGGGTLISAQAVLTVAQNVFGFQSWRVGLGAIRIADLTFFGAEQAIVHPAYNASSLANNVAILRLFTDVTLSPNIFPISRTAEGSQFPSAGNVGYALGFGFGATNIQPDILQQARFTVLSQTECGAAYPHLDWIEQMDMHFCAQNATVASNICAGDQGGPIFIAELNILFGIQSFNRVADCSSPEAQPAAFIRVSHYATFINQYI